MKKILLIVVVLALLVPAAALAATEFSLGGYIMLNSLWDSTQNAFSPTAVIARNNDQLFHHGRLIMTAQQSRFNFTIKGPKLWGATTTGFIEMDFDTNENRQSNTHSYTPRLRHAMFRLNWPETELMFGQYWGMMSEYAPDVTGDSQFTNHGFINQRAPQIRLTQKFAGAWTVAGAIVKPYDPAVSDVNWAAAGNTNNAGQVQYTPTADVNTWEGQSSETPQLQAKLAYEQDLYGKAAFFGRPRGFTAQMTGAWQRTRYKNNTPGNAFAYSTFGQNAFGAAAAGLQNGQQYLDPWCLQGTLFIPVIPTHSANLAGTASLTAQYFIGQGVSFVGGGRDQDNSWLDFSGINGAGFAVYDRKLTNQYGGYLQGQYWFDNQWFVNLTWGFIRDYGFDQGRSALLTGQGPAALIASNPAGYKYAANNDQVKLWQEYALTLWYRPIEAIKFGLQYSYERNDFLQKVNNPANATLWIPPGGGNAAVVNNQNSAGSKNIGEAHRIQFTAQMFF
jgi:hypothetical protein